MFGTQTPFEDLDGHKLDGLPLFDFDCGSPEQNSFLHERAWPEQQDSLSTTYLFFRGGMLAAYVTSRC